MATNKIIYKSEYNKGYHKDFYLFHMTHKSSFIYIMPLLMLLLLMLMINNNNNKETDNIYTYIAFAVSIFIFIPIYLFFAVNSNVRRDSKNRSDCTETIEISKEKILRSESKNNEQKGKEVISWQQLLVVHEQLHYFYFYKSNEQGFLVAKELLTKEEINTIRDFCTKYLKKDQKGKIPFKQTRKIKRMIKNENNKWLQSIY